MSDQRQKASDPLMTKLKPYRCRMWKRPATEKIIFQYGTKRAAREFAQLVEAPEGSIIEIEDHRLRRFWPFLVYKNAGVDRVDPGTGDVDAFVAWFYDLDDHTGGEE